MCHTLNHINVYYIIQNFLNQTKSVYILTLIICHVSVI